MAAAEQTTLHLTPDSMCRLAEHLRPLGGRLTRWKIVAGGVEREWMGRVARSAEWLAPEDPHLLVAPGQTNLTNVLAFIALHLRWRGDEAFLIRRRSYEAEPLEWEALGTGPVTLIIECLPE